MLSLIKPGTRVLISRDCRPGHPATGMEGTYEGDFPRSVVFGLQQLETDKPQWLGEFPYDDYHSGKQKLHGRGCHDMAANSFFIEWEKGKEQPRPYFAMVRDNPRIKLDDGSTIRGDECWWDEITPGLTLEKAQEDTEVIKELLAALANDFHKKEGGENEQA